MLTKLKTKTM